MPPTASMAMPPNRIRSGRKNSTAQRSSAVAQRSGDIVVEIDMHVCVGDDQHP